MIHKQAQGLQRVLDAFRYTFAGLRACFAHEEAFRQEAIAGLLIVPLALWLGDTGAERALLAGSWALVLVVELLNSAVEATVDRIGPERHELSGRAKDLGSAAVFCSISIASLVWLLVLLPRWL